eukprot:TRINITY_DN7645_c0_g1_i1.p1 TRINITY_DN7645_c0_g1~~TRINITY_DN7645_c0_g1_i1.p1  ORF type:complete len:307 (+),score=79.78 TRINITY_DN7645_c0_g1_i1:269-1189(+)
MKMVLPLCRLNSDHVVLFTRRQRLSLGVSCLLSFLLLLSVVRGDEKLIGWQGERQDLVQKQQQQQQEQPQQQQEQEQEQLGIVSAPARANASAAGEEDDGGVWVELLSWQPRAFHFHNFLTARECLYLIHRAAPNMVKSSVVDSATGRSKDSRVRTSSGTFLLRGEDEVVRAIEERIADYTFIPVEHGENIQVLHYEEGQKYEQHYDYFHDKLNTRNGGQRIATLLMYLTDVEEGGETVFPAAKANMQHVDYGRLSACAQKGLAVRPRRGDALLFWSARPDASLDPKSLHGGGGGGCSWMPCHQGG